MTTLVSIFGIAGRVAGDLTTSAMGWASSLLFGRVPRSHQIFLVGMMAGSFLWILMVAGLVLPEIASVLLANTPHPPFVDRAWLAVALVIGVLVLPLAVGFAGYLVPAPGERQPATGVPREIARGYLLVPVISGLLVFLAGVGITRKVRSLRHGWSDAHVPIVVMPHGYDQLVIDLQDVLASADLRTTAGDAPWVLTLPARILTSVAGSNVRKLRPDRLIELTGPGLRIGVYPSDIAISGDARDRTRARAAILSRLATTSAHLTTSAEAQKVEDRLGRLAATRGPAGRMPEGDWRAALTSIDAGLLDLDVPTDEWDILYRMRLQIERDLLVGAAPGTKFPGHESDQHVVADPRASSVPDGGPPRPRPAPGMAEPLAGPIVGGGA